MRPEALGVPCRGGLEGMLTVAGSAMFLRHRHSPPGGVMTGSGLYWSGAAEWPDGAQPMAAAGQRTAAGTLLRQ